MITMKTGIWAAALLFFLASLGRSCGHVTSDTSRGDGVSSGGVSALLALLQQQSSAISRVHADLDRLTDDLTTTERKMDAMGSRLTALEHKVEDETAKRLEGEGVEDALGRQVTSVEQALKDDLQELRTHTAARLQQLANKVEAASGVRKPQAGFMAGLRKDQTLPTGVVVKFDVVQYNEGNAYHPSTGVFTAPVSGMYTFFMKTEETAGKEMSLQMLKEGKRVLYIYASDNSNFETSSGQVVLHLALGQRVWVQTSHGLNFIRSPWTRFGGFLVHPDAE